MTLLGVFDEKITLNPLPDDNCPFTRELLFNGDVPPGKKIPNRLRTTRTGSDWMNFIGNSKGLNLTSASFG
jgi:hypothetical protein